VIIYDAISGALSEEDINNMYQQKFKDAKFVVLVDDLFPINAQNLKPQKKMLIPRESTPLIKFYLLLPRLLKKQRNTNCPL
jgi:hypothetical protein